MYLVNTRPDICYAVNTLSQFMVEPKRVHWVASKHVIRYLQGIIELGLKYTHSNDVRLSGFTDADWAGSSVDWKSTSGYCFSLGSGMTSWCSRKQNSIALSSAEARSEEHTSEDDEADPTLYRQLIGYLMYLVNTRPNICYAVNTLNQFMVEPKRAHWAAAKHVLRSSLD